jgi:tRNA(adenine34) deaminase
VSPAVFFYNHAMSYKNFLPLEGQNLPMMEALKIAQETAACDEVPVGAVLVYQGHMIAQAGNAVLRRHDPTAHAEMLVLREAGQKLKTAYLEMCDLYVTLEPCAMCAQAIALARIRRLYFGAYDSKGGGVEHGAKIFSHATCHHRPEIYGGILEKECGHILKEYFKKKRNL